MEFSCKYVSSLSCSSPQCTKNGKSIGNVEAILEASSPRVAAA